MRISAQCTNSQVRIQVLYIRSCMCVHMGNFLIESFAGAFVCLSCCFFLSNSQGIFNTKFFFFLPVSKKTRCPMHYSRIRRGEGVCHPLFTLNSFVKIHIVSAAQRPPLLLNGSETWAPAKKKGWKKNVEMLHDAGNELYWIYYLKYTKR